MRWLAHLFSRPPGKPGRAPDNKTFPMKPPNAPGKPARKGKC